MKNNQKVRCGKCGKANLKGSAHNSRTCGKVKTPTVTATPKKVTPVKMKPHKKNKQPTMVNSDNQALDVLKRYVKKPHRTAKKWLKSTAHLYRIPQPLYDTAEMYALNLIYHRKGVKFADTETVRLAQKNLCKTYLLKDPEGVCLSEFLKDAAVPVKDKLVLTRTKWLVTQLKEKHATNPVTQTVRTVQGTSLTGSYAVREILNAQRS